MLYDREPLAEVVRDGGDAGGPQKCSGEIVYNERAIAHLYDARDYGSEGPYDGDETCEDNGICAVLVVKILCVLEMFVPEKTGVGPEKELNADFVAKPVAGVVAKDGSNRDERDKDPYIEESLRRQEPRGEKERGTGEEKSEENAGFEEDRCEKPRIAHEFNQWREREEIHLRHYRTTVRIRRTIRG